MPHDYSISLFFPAYNEEKNIVEAISQAIEVLGMCAKQYEIIIVDDGSTDGTAQVVRDISRIHPIVKLVQHVHNKGYGDALITGIQESRYDLIFFADADLQFDLHELVEFMKYINEYDAVIGYRKNRQDNFVRIMNARLWNIANLIVFGLRVRDIDCAFKLMKSKYIKAITLKTGGQMTSAEMLLKLHQANASIKELPVMHFPRKAGVQTGAKMSNITRALKEMWHLYSTEMAERARIQFIKFVIIGCVNTLTAFVIYFVLTRSFNVFFDYYLWSEAIAYISGSVAGFTLNRRWTFYKKDEVDIFEMIRYGLTYTTGLAVNVGMLYVLTSYLYLHDLISVLLATCITIAWNFALSKYWVFKRY